MYLFTFVNFVVVLVDGSMSVSREFEDLRQMKLVLGSKPPRCANKCSSCRPCMAALAVPPHHNNIGLKTASNHQDESYYFLTWKCRCRNKFFQP